MSLIDWSSNPLPQKVSINGLEIPAYLDDESIRELKRDNALCNKANWIIHTQQGRRKSSLRQEASAIERVINKLKSARLAYQELSTTNKYRILESKGAELLNQMLEQATYCEQNPLPQKAKLENLYLSFGYERDQKGSQLNNLDEKDFITFMAVIVRHIENELGTSVLDHEAKVTKQLKRVYKKAKDK